MQRKDTTIAVALALVVVFFAFGGSLFSHLIPVDSEASRESDALLSLDRFSLEEVSFQTIDLGIESKRQEAWHLLDRYISAAQAHDIDTLRALSHQLSPACIDNTQAEECSRLMDSVHFFLTSLDRKNFTKVAYDERQTVLSTPYLDLGEGDPVKTVLLFTRPEGSSLKVLGMRLCFGNEGVHDECVETDPAKRDLDSDGWWDDVEALFR